jgi:hypothetical protein
MGPLQTSSVVRTQAMLPVTLWQAGAVANRLKRLARPAHVALLNTWTLNPASGSQVITQNLETQTALASSERSFAKGSGVLAVQGPVVTVAEKQRRFVATNAAKAGVGADAAGVAEKSRKKGGAFEWDSEELRRIQEEKEKWLKDRASRCEPYVFPNVPEPHICKGFSRSVKPSINFAKHHQSSLYGCWAGTAMLS